jgi:hypothetical protein
MLDTDPLADVAEAIRLLATNLDGNASTALALGAGWTGFANYRYASGICSVHFVVSKATWASSETIASGLPAAYRPVLAPMWFQAMSSNLFTAVSCAITQTGILQPVLANGAHGTGLRGIVSWVVGL